jgi:hypothetical protein
MLYAELGIGRRAQAVRDRRHGVGLLDRERDDARIRWIAADQGDVGSMQRGDDARPLSIGAEDLSRQKCRRRMRDGVMRVDDIELRLARDLHDAIRQ